jgi:hypothetical protein
MPNLLGVGRSIYKSLNVQVVCCGDTVLQEIEYSLEATGDDPVPWWFNGRFVPLIFCLFNGQAIRFRQGYTIAESWPTLRGDVFVPGQHIVDGDYDIYLF